MSPNLYRIPLEVAGVVMRYGPEIRQEDFSSCAWYRGVGTCSFGCWEEPACQTNEPLDGWPRERMLRELTKVTR